MNQGIFKQISISLVLIIILSSISLGSYIDQMMPFWIVSFYSYILFFNTVKNAYFIALLLGLILDIIHGNIIGQGAFALLLSSYFVVKTKLLLKVANTITAMIFVFVASVIYVVSLIFVHSLVQGFDLDYSILLSSFTTAAVYPVVAHIMQIVNGTKN